MSLRRLYLGKSPARPNENESALDYLDHTDEGYVEQRFEPPEFMLSWSDEQKAEFAYQLLLTIPTSRTLKVVDRLTPLLHRDVISLLPYELALHILSYVDALTLTRVSHVSRKWRTFSEDQTLWRALFLDQGWHFDQKAMDDYLNNTPSSQRRSMLDRATPEDVLTDDTSVRPRFSPVPLSRSTVNVYDPSDLSAISSPSGRLRPFKRTSDLLLRLRQRRTLHHYSLRGQGLEPSTSCSLPSDPAPSFSASYIPHNLDVSETDSRNIVDAESYTLVGSASSSSSSSQSNVARRNATLQPIPFPLPLSLAAPTSHSRSQPIYSHRRQLSPSSSSSPSRVVDPSTIRNSVSSNSRLLPSITSSDLSTTRLFKNRPTPRRHVKYDETALYHYNEATDGRFINWRRLYRNRFIIDKRWREGKCKMKTFPPNNNALTDMHLEGIYCIQFDDNKIISGSRDRTIKVWDMQTGECRRTLLGHTASVLCLQYDDRYIISGSSDANIIQWDVDTGEIIRTLYGHDKSVLNLRFRGNRIVSCSKDCTLRIWDLESGTTIRILRGHRAAVNAVQFTDDRIVSASGDRTIKLWDMETGVCLRTFDSHSRGIACVEFDGKRIVSGSSDQTIKVWNPETGECLHTLVGHTDLVRTLQLDAEADRIISGSYDGSLKIWSLSQGCLVRSLGQAIEGRVLNLQFDYARIVCCTNLAKIVKYDFAYGIDTQFLK